MSDKPLDDEDWQWEQRDQRLSRIEAFCFGVAVGMLVIAMIMRCA